MPDRMPDHRSPVVGLESGADEENEASFTDPRYDMIVEDHPQPLFVHTAGIKAAGFLAFSAGGALLSVERRSGGQPA